MVAQRLTQNDRGKKITCMEKLKSKAKQKKLERESHDQLQEREAAHAERVGEHSAAHQQAMLIEQVKALREVERVKHEKAVAEGERDRAKDELRKRDEIAHRHRMIADKKKREQELLQKTKLGKFRPSRFGAAGAATNEDSVIFGKKRT